jgi:uncharacterized protein YecE (DUF72 family)
LGELYFGTAGWSYPDWKGVVYPPAPGGSFDELAYLAEYFDAVEVNATFYRHATARNAEAWVRRTEKAPGFLFTVKLHRCFTHERDVGWGASDAEAFRNGTAPLAEAGKLGAVLLQFPWSFRNTQANRRHLADLAREFHDLPKVVELRHASWMVEAAVKFLGALGLGFCNIDQPEAKDSIGPASVVTGPVGYVRFHGRNRENWFRRDAGRDARYDYLYGPEELDGWIPRVRAVNAGTQKTFVIGNNHFKGQAPANILQIKQRMEGGEVRAPESLRDIFPFLRESGGTDP